MCSPRSAGAPPGASADVVDGTGYEGALRCAKGLGRSGPSASVRARPSFGRSLAAGIVTWFCVPVVFAIVAIHLGHKAKDAAEMGKADNAHLASVGIVLGWTHIAVMGLLLLVRLVIYVIGMSGGYA